jgi:hypothetical protein
MGLSKWDKISKADAKEMSERISYIIGNEEGERVNVFSCMDHDFYRDLPKGHKIYTVRRTDELVRLGDGIKVQHTQDAMYPTLAEIFSQIPQGQRFIIDAIEIRPMTSLYDAVAGAFETLVLLYTFKKEVPERTGPLTARELYIQYLEEASKPHSERTGIMKHSSLSDPSHDRTMRQALKKKIEEAQTMPEDELSYEIGLFLMQAFRQR